MFSESEMERMMEGGREKHRGERETVKDTLPSTECTNELGFN